jgi:hypothetical protein
MMNAGCALVLAAAMSLAAQTAPAPSGADAVTILEQSRDRPALLRAAVALASSGNSKDLDRLGEFLENAEFLARLDDLRTPSEKTRNLAKVLAALADHPSRASERLCLALAADPTFLADDDRRIYLLPALHAVRPMSQEAAEVFRRANQDGFFSATAPLLVKNASPRALALFEEMIRDRSVPVERRVDALHASILPARTNPAVLDCVGRLLAAALERDVAAAAIESVFDYRSRLWFGPPRTPPAPPAWESASRDALRKVLQLASTARGHDLSPDLSAAIDRTKATVQRILGNSR